MNVVNGYEYYPMPIDGTEPLSYKFTKTTRLCPDAPWEGGTGDGPFVDSKTPIRGAWMFAYRKVEARSALNVQPTKPFSASAEVAAAGVPWSYIYHVTLVDNRDGWVDISSITSDKPQVATKETIIPSVLQADPTEHPGQNLVVIGIIVACLFLLRKEIRRWF